MSSQFEIPQWIKDNVAYGRKIYDLIREPLYFSGAGIHEQAKAHFAGNVIVELKKLGLINEYRLQELLTNSKDGELK